MENWFVYYNAKWYVNIFHVATHAHDLHVCILFIVENSCSYICSLLNNMQNNKFFSYTRMYFCWSDKAASWIDNIASTYFCQFKIASYIYIYSCMNNNLLDLRELYSLD